MAAFVVNGTPVTVEKNQKLIRYLRDELHLTSVKDGCSEGACGTCHVLIDGKPTKACIPQTDKLEGKTHPHGRGPFRLGKGGLYLRLRRGPEPCSAASAFQAWSSRPRRCSTRILTPRAKRRPLPYATISAAARAMSRSSTASCSRRRFYARGKFPKKKEDFQVGSRVHRIDVAEKVQGYGKYPDDVYVDGMCYGGAVRSQYPRARVLCHPHERGGSACLASSAC